MATIRQFRTILNYFSGTSGTSMELFFDLEALVYNNNMNKYIKVPAFFQKIWLLYIIFFYIYTVYVGEYFDYGNKHDDREGFLGYVPQET